MVADARPLAFVLPYLSFPPQPWPRGKSRPFVLDSPVALPAPSHYLISQLSSRVISLRAAQVAFHLCTVVQVENELLLLLSTFTLIQSSIKRVSACETKYVLLLRMLMPSQMSINRSSGRPHLPDVSSRASVVDRGLEENVGG